jgi:hypothetical protein
MKPAFKTFKLEDVKELQELVAEHVDGIEPGMRLLDSRVLLGGATIDVLAHDASGGLTLLALGFVADDEMLLRALEAYSWCLEYPEALRRLYPSVRLSATDPPRVLFVAERVTDAFLRKIKHLRFERADCLEFRFGLQFNVVDGPRATDDQFIEPLNGHQPGSRQANGHHVNGQANGHVATANIEPATSPSTATVTTNGADRKPRHETVEPATSGHATGLNGQHHSSSDNTSPQWDQVLSRAAGEVDEWKVKAVREYLQREFPTAVIYDFYAHDRGAQMFHLQDSQGSVVHSASVAEDLIEECTDAQLRAFLDKHKLARVLRQAGQAGVSVTKAGLKIERR